MASKRLETAKKFVDHYAENDNDVLHSILADDLKYTFSPSRSLNDPKTYEKAGFIGFKEAMKAAMTGYPLDVIQYIDSESSNSKLLDTSNKRCDPVSLPVHATTMDLSLDDYVYLPQD